MIRNTLAAIGIASIAIMLARCGPERVEAAPVDAFEWDVEHGSCECVFDDGYDFDTDRRRIHDTVCRVPGF